MGQKVNPKSFRLSLNKNWQSRWISKNLFAYMLCADTIIRQAIKDKLGRKASIDSIEIERGVQEQKISIHTSQPGIIIGRQGKGITELKEYIESKLKYSRLFLLINSSITPEALEHIMHKLISNMKININEIRNPETKAQLVADNIATQIEKRMHYRRVIKQAIERVMNNKDIKGIKICISGRLGGIDIARSEKFSKGSIPLGTLRAVVDYAYCPAQLAYAGTIGIKVWIYTGLKVK